MKRLVVIIFLGVLMINANAQDSTARQQKFMFGIHGGAGPAALVGSDRHWGSWARNLTYTVGSINGIVFQYRASQRVSFCFEVNYETKGYAETGTYPGMWDYDVDNTIPWGGKTKYFYDFITVPALAQFKINKLSKRTEWFVKCGMSPEFMVRSGVIYGNRKKQYDIQHFDLSSVLGFGVNIPVKKHVVISVEGRDNLTMGDITNYKRSNLFVLMVGLGYKI